MTPFYLSLETSQCCVVTHQSSGSSPGLQGLNPLPLGPLPTFQFHSLLFQDSGRKDGAVLPSHLTQGCLPPLLVWLQN